MLFNSFLRKSSEKIVLLLLSYIKSNFSRQLLSFLFCSMQKYKFNNIFWASTMNLALFLEHWLQSPILFLHNLTPILTLIPTLTLKNPSFTIGPLRHRVIETLFKVVQLGQLASSKSVLTTTMHTVTYQVSLIFPSDKIIKLHFLSQVKLSWAIRI